jgi:hypothetical protein
VCQNGCFFVSIAQVTGFLPAVFLDLYFTYFFSEVRYNEFADEETDLRRVMNGGIKGRLRAPEYIGRKDMTE